MLSEQAVQYFLAYNSALLPHRMSIIETACSVHQACLPVKDLDLGYNLVRTHDGKGAFVIVDHDEVDPVASRAPMSTVYASGVFGDPPDTLRGIVPSAVAMHAAPKFTCQQCYHVQFQNAQWPIIQIMLTSSSESVYYLYLCILCKLALLSATSYCHAVYRQ